MKVLILGGTGLLSSGITEKCLGKGYEVFHFNRGNTTSPDGVRQIKGDRYNKESLTKALEIKPDVVIDMLCFQPEHAQLSTEVFAGKVEQYIYCSTSCVYTPKITDEKIYEDSDTNPDTEYGKNKLAAERVFLDAMKKKAFEVSIFRPGHVYGNDFLVSNLTFEGGYVLARMMRNQDIILTDGGKRRFQACHKNNVGNAFAECCGNKNAFGQIYNIAGEEFFQWNDLYELWKKVVGSNSHIVYVNSDDVVQLDRERFDFLATYTKFDWMQSTEKLKKDLSGYQYEIDVESGIRKFVKDNYETIQSCYSEETIYQELLKL